MSRSQLFNEINKALPFLPEHFQQKGQTLDSAFSGYRLHQELSGSCLDLILMSYRFAHFFELKTKEFSQKKLKPQALKDLWLLGFTAILTRDKTPAFAIVSECVEASKQKFGKHTSGITNAFLRHVERQKEIYLKQISHSPSVMLPKWLTERWSPLSTEFLNKLGHSLSSRPSSGVTGFDENLNFKQVAWNEALFKNSENQFQAINQGSFAFCEWAKKQLGSSTKSFVDTCAAPGGKAVYFLQNQKLQNLKPSSICFEAKHTRLELLKDNLKRWNFDTTESVKSFLHEWGTDKPPQELISKKWDFVLCDLPCSGSGTLLTRPDVLFKNWSKEITALKPIQTKILDDIFKINSHKFLISICSVDPEEIANISKTLKIEPSFSSWHLSDTFDGSFEGITAWYCERLPSPLQ